MKLKKLVILLSDFYPLFYQNRKAFSKKNNLFSIFPRNYEVVFWKLLYSLKNWPDSFDSSLKLKTFYFILLNEIRNFFCTNFFDIEDFTYKKLKKKNLYFFLNNFISPSILIEILNFLEIRDTYVRSKFNFLIEDSEEQLKEVKEELEGILLFFEHANFPLKDYILQKDKEIINGSFSLLNRQGVVNNKEVYVDKEISIRPVLLEETLSFYLILLLKPFMKVSEEQVLNFFNYILLGDGEIEKEYLEWFNLISSLSFLLSTEDEISYLERKNRDQKEDFEYKILLKKYNDKKKECIMAINKIAENI